LKDVVIIGAGAAGFFAAAEVLRQKPNAHVLMLEKTGKVLAKVKISGGGRCNVTHNCLDKNALLQFYPRGNPWLKDVFEQFSVKDTLAWFQNKGVKIVAEGDGRMFPQSNESQTIIDALENATSGKNFALSLHSGVKNILPLEQGFEIQMDGGNSILTKTVLVASGGSPSGSGFSFLKTMDFEIVPPVPSLFTFNVKKHIWSDLMGLSVNLAKVSLDGTDLGFTGPLLVTHWGFSGPAVLKLSAFAARILHEKNYRYRFFIDWLPEQKETELLNQLVQFQTDNPKRKPDQSQIFPIPKRLWEQICNDSGLSAYFNWAEAGKKKIAMAAQLLKKSTFEAEGKTTYKEEFVTSGGIDLKGISPKTCESKRFPGLFFAGEVMDVDGITGGFNFQAAWSTSFVAAREIGKRI
jgi:predicted Rossmann fold flavoprotein